MMSNSLQRILFDSRTVSDALRLFLADGDVVSHLVSSGINDVYRTERGRFVKVFNPHFVNPSSMAKVYEALSHHPGSLEIFSLPIRGHHDGRLLMSIAAFEQERYASVFESAGLQPLDLADEHRATDVCLRVGSVLEAIEADVRPLLPQLGWQDAAERLRRALAPWLSTSASPSAIQICSALDVIESTHPSRFLTGSCVQHGDLHHHNIFCSELAFKVIDLDFVCVAPRGYDGATLAWMSLRRRGVREPSTLSSDLDGFGDSLWGRIFSEGSWSSAGLLALIALRHVFFLTIQAKLWETRGSQYASDERTLREITFLRAIATALSAVAAQ